MKILVHFKRGWRSLCLIVFVSFLFSCKTISNSGTESSHVKLAVLVEKGYRIVGIESGDVLIIEDSLVEQRTTATILFPTPSISRIEAMRRRLLAQGAVKVELIEDKD